MKRSLLEIYALAVCFITLACFVITAGVALWNGVRFAAPAFTIDSFRYTAHQSEANFARYQRSTARPVAVARDGLPPAKGDARPTGDPGVPDLTREESWAAVLDGERRGALQGVVRQGIILFLTLVTFLLHWRLAAGIGST